MAYEISQIKSDLGRKIHGTTLNKVSGLYNLIWEAGRNLQNKMDLYETVRSHQIANAVYDSVYDYDINDDVKHPLYIRPLVNSSVGDNNRHVLQEEFDLNKKDGTYTILRRDNSEFLRISLNLTSPKIFANFDTTTNWTAGGDAGTLTRDTLQKISGSASLNFDLDGNTTTGYVENTSLTSIDASDEEDIGALFLWAYFPNSSAITNVILRWGSSSSDYWSQTVISGHFSSFRNGWNLLRFDWDGATETGTPLSSVLDYARVTITYNGTADTDFRIDSLTVNRGEIYELVYYSDYIFTDTTGSTWKEVPTVDTDVTVCGADSYNMLLYEIAELLAQELQGSDASVDLTYFAEKNKEATKNYKNSFPSQREKKTGNYYTSRGKSRSFGTRVIR